MTKIPLSFGYNSLGFAGNKFLQNLLLYNNELSPSAIIPPKGGLSTWGLMVIGAVFTSIYSFKLLFYTFLTSPNFPKPLPLVIIPKASPSKAITPPKWGFTLGKSYLLLPLYVIPTMGSLFLGFFIFDLFGGGGGDLEYIPWFIKLIPLCAGLAGVLLGGKRMSLGGKNRPGNKLSNNLLILTILNKRFFFDSIINYLLASKFINWGYSYTFKLLDKGFLELFGPVGLTRSVFLLPPFPGEAGKDKLLLQGKGFPFYPKEINKSLFPGVVYLLLTFGSLLTFGGF